MFRYGVELEGFRCYQSTSGGDKVCIPNNNDPVDGFPGLVELRSTGASEIAESDRQPGMYAIKEDIRLEYRSLPNFAYDDKFYDRVMKVVRTVLL